MTASVTTTAEGDAEGSETAVGAVFALTYANHLVESYSSRALDAAGGVTFEALGTSSSASNAKASAAGAPEDDGSGTQDVNDDIAAERAGADARAADNGVADSGDTDEPSAEDSSGDSVSVAAAIAVNISLSRSSARILDGSTVAAGGAVTVRSSAHSDAKATADGSSATAAGGTAIGAAVAINYAEFANEATIGYGADVDSNGLTVEALMTGGAASTHDFGAKAVSGAGGGETGVAGSFALNIVSAHTWGVLLSDPIRGPPGSPSGFDPPDTPASVDAGTGDVTFKALSKAASDTKAWPDGDGGAGTDLGIGASIAISIVNDAAVAAVEDTATLTGGASLTVDASGEHTLTTEAKTGAKGTTSVAAAVAVAISNVTVVGLLGVDGSKDRLETLRRSAAAHLERLGQGTDVLRGVFEFVISRTS